LWRGKIGPVNKKQQLVEFESDAADCVKTGALSKPLLLWKGNKYYIFLCVDEGMRVRASVDVGERALACAGL
jgi:hypothetical protein